MPVMLSDSDTPGLIHEGPSLANLREQFEAVEEFPGEGNEFDNDDPLSSLEIL